MSLGSRVDVLQRSSFTVTKSTPGTTRVKFTLSDSTGLLTTSKMVRAVLVDAINQFIAAEAADLENNGDGNLSEADFKFNFEGKYAETTLTALTSISTSGTITAAAPFANV